MRVATIVCDRCKRECRANELSSVEVYTTNHERVCILRDICRDCFKHIVDVLEEAATVVSIL